MIAIIRIPEGDMLGTLIIKEILDSIGTMKFLITFIVVAILIVSGLVIGSRNYVEQTGDIVRQQSLNEEMLSSQFDWFRAGYTGIFESKKPYVLSVFDSGVDNSLGRIAQISTFKDTRLDESRNTASPILAVFGEVDLTFVVKIVLSLFVIMLTYDAVSGEKERGTLKLMLANKLPRHKILLSKIVGGITVLAVTFLVPILIGIAYLMLAQPEVINDFDNDAWIRLVFIVLVYFLYLSAFVAIGLAVSSVSHNSATSFIVLLMIWVLFVAIIPGLSMTAAERIRPAKSYATLQANAYKKIANDQRGLIMDMMSKWSSDMSSDPAAFSDVYTDFLNDLSRIHQENLDRFNRSFEKAQHSQIVLAESISRVFSPTSAMSFAVQNLAGSGWARQQEYLDQLREFRTSFGQYIQSEIAKQEFTSMDDMLKKRELITDRAQITFKFQEEPLDVVLTRSLPDMAILAGVALICFLFSAIFFARYDVR